MTTTNTEIHERARQVIPGGVNSPVRAFGPVGREPLVARRAAGAYLWDADGRRYIDYIQSWGASVLGHADPTIVDRIRAAAGDGTSFGLSTLAEVELAEELCGAVPSLEMVRLVSSGTEATMSAIRLARGFTGRDLVLKFEGCYHGHSDALLAAAGSGIATLGLPGSAGVPEGAVANTVVVPYNDLDAVEDVFLRDGSRIAAVIVEPVAANMGLIPPAAGFLEGLRRVTSAHDSLLIFDEVITGFRLGRGGAQAMFGVLPDLTTLGKAIGGGMPLAGFGGSREVMSRLAPLGDVYQAGTLSGNPIATAAGLAAVRALTDSVFIQLAGRVEWLDRALTEAVTEAGLPFITQSLGTLMGFFFSDSPVSNYTEARAADGEMYAEFFRELIDRGVLVAPSPFEALFVSMAHGKDELERTSDLAAAAAAAIAARR